MKKIVTAIQVLAVILMASSCRQNGSKVIQISKYWDFDTDTPQAEAVIHNECREGFTVRLNSVIPEGDSTLLEIPGVLTIKTLRVPDGGWDLPNYIQFRMPDSGLPVLQAELRLYNKLMKKGSHTFYLGYPLSLIDNLPGTHDIVLQFTGARAELYIDSRLADAEAVLGYPVQDTSRKWTADGDYKFFTPAVKPVRIDDRGTTANNIQYWSPEFYNAWVGDVVTYYYKGRYHLFYLMDRHHHRSKLGGGGHWFEHISTADFKTWTEHKPAVTLDEQWQSAGTGLPFEDEQGRLCLSIGWHTGRFCLPATTTYDSLNAEALKNAYVDPVRFEDTDLIPEGSTWYVCTNGLDEFEPSKVLFHPCENPGIFKDRVKGYRMYAANRGSGTWASDSLKGRWTCVDRNFPPGGDCTFPFKWGDYDYIVGGFKDAWYKPVKESSTDAFKALPDSLGNCYDGLSVPCITKIPGNRYITAGWTRNEGWGGYLVIHELVRHPDGTLGVKWMDEVTPKTEKPYLSMKNASDNLCTLNRGQSCIISFDIVPDKPHQGLVSVDFADSENPQNALSWTIDLAAAKAQFCGSPAGESVNWVQTVSEGARADKLRDYCIEGGMDCRKAIHVRIALYCNQKCNGTLCDCEIGGGRVMMNYRQYLIPDSVKFNCAEASIRNLKVAAFQN